METESQLLKLMAYHVRHVCPVHGETEHEVRQSDDFKVYVCILCQEKWIIEALAKD